jgi:hypothetical protein
VTSPRGPQYAPGRRHAPIAFPAFTSPVNAPGLALASPLPVSSGGTGQVSLTPHAALIGNGTGPVNTIAPGAAGTVLTSNGTTSDPSYQAASGGVPAPGVNGSVLASNGTVAAYTRDLSNLNSVTLSGAVGANTAINVGATGATAGVYLTRVNGTTTGLPVLSGDLIGILQASAYDGSAAAAAGILRVVA